MDNPETQTTQQRLTKKEAIKNGQSRDPDNTTQTNQKGAIRNGQSRDPDNTEQRLTKKTQHRILEKEQHGFYQQ